MKPKTMRGDQRQCQTCQNWFSHTRFNKRRRQSPEGTFWEFDLACRACQQKARNLKKNEDRGRAIIERRARATAAKCGASFDFFWHQLNWQSIVPLFRALAAAPDASCQSCGHPYDNERDIQIEHILPPRSLTDWARHHARNLRFLCTNCNRSKSTKDHGTWLDDEEGARLANEANNVSRAAPALMSVQLAFSWA